MPLFTLAVLGIGLLIATPTVRAQEYSPDVRQRGYAQGYRDGYDLGRDARAHDRPLYFDTESYRDGDRGYRVYMGHREDYRTAYRDGYRVGAEDGFAGLAIRDEHVYVIEERPSIVVTERPWADRDVANETGYRDGLAAGLKDFRDGHSFRPAEHDQWKDADHGYHNVYGSKDEYRRAYRTAYETGYRVGYGGR